MTAIVALKHLFTIINHHVQTGPSQWAGSRTTTFLSSVLLPVLETCCVATVTKVVIISLLLSFPNCLPFLLLCLVHTSSHVSCLFHQTMLCSREQKGENAMTARWVDANRNSVPFCFIFCLSFCSDLASFELVSRTHAHSYRGEVAWYRQRCSFTMYRVLFMPKPFFILLCLPGASVVDCLLLILLLVLRGMIQVLTML